MARDPAERSTHLDTTPRVARDGTQRGMKRQGSKNKVTLLIEAIQEAVQRDTGMVNWDPLVMMSVIAARAYSGYAATDEQGRAIIDENGNPVMVPPDFALAAVAAGKVAPYIHQQLRPRDVGDEDSAQRDPDEKRDRVLAAFENMGVKVVRDE